MKKKRSLRGSYAILLTCLGVSFFCWFAVKISKTYIAEYHLEVSFVNLPEDKELISLSDSIITVVFEDKGFAFLSLELSSKKIKIDYQEITTSYQKKQNIIYIQSRQIKNYMKEKRKYSKNIKSIDPDIICLRFQNK